ncbi:hypothetical protein KAT63_00055 [Candidatus Parcubacteria bacterium]|nr:hypothetical protein [Candidatus Parcubacteria bacterium]
MESKILKIIKDQNGQIAFLIVFIIMSLLLFISLFLTNMTMKQTKITRNTLNSVQAYYLADMGAERVLCGIKKPLGDVNKINISDFNIDDEIIRQDNIIEANSYYKAIKVNPIAPSTLNIKISGKFRETMRAIELSWN